MSLHIAHNVNKPMSAVVAPAATASTPRQKAPATHTSSPSVPAPVDSAPAVPLQNRYASDDQLPKQLPEKHDQDPTVRLNLSPRRPTAPAGKSVHTPDNEPSSRVKRQTATGSRWSLIGTYVPPATSWTIEARPVTSPEISIAQNRELQRRVEEKLTGKRDRAVYVPAGASAYPALEVFERAVKQPEVLDWLASKSIDLTSIMIKSDSISGNLSHNGKPVTFTTSDDSGWWQVSNKIRAAAKAVDPKNNGMSYPDRDPNEPGISMMRNTVLQFYGMDKPVSDNEARITAYVLNSAGLPGPGSSTIELRHTREQRATRQIDEIDERKLLASKLERIVVNLPDEAPVSLSENFDVELSGSAPLREKHRTAAVKLKKFLELSSVKLILLAEGIRFPDETTFRINGKALEFLEGNGHWKDFSHRINWVENLKPALDELVMASKKTGGKIYSRAHYDMQQVLKAKGFGSAKTAGGLRNVIQWLKHSLPPVPASGNYAALLSEVGKVGELSAADRHHLHKISSEHLYNAHSFFSVVGAQLLPTKTDEDIRNNADRYLDQLLNDKPAIKLGNDIATSIHWYGSGGSNTLSKAQGRNLLVAALKLSVGTDAHRIPGTIAGYEIYNPKNYGRRFDEVRNDIEEHLISTQGLARPDAILMAHLFLAKEAPEFLVKEGPEKIRIGTSAWLNLRLGTSFAESVGGVGSSRAMTDKEVIATSQLGPIGIDQQKLFAALGTAPLLDWAVMQGVISRPVGSSYSPEQYEAASSAFLEQTREGKKALGVVATPPDRAHIALTNLKALFPEMTEQELLTHKYLPSGPVYDELGKHIGLARMSLPDAYATGRLKPGDYKFVNRVISQEAFDRQVGTLEPVADLIGPNVDKYMSSLNEARSTMTKLALSQLPLEERQAIEKGQVQIFSLRENNQAGVSNHGTLMRTHYNGQVRHYEIFPASMTLIPRPDLPVNLVPDEGQFVSKVASARLANTMRYTYKGPAPFDMRSYMTGSPPTAGATSSNVTLERLATFNGQTGKVRHLGHHSSTPYTFNSPRVNALTSSILTLNPLQEKQQYLDYAEAPLPVESTNAYRVSQVFSRETARAIIAMVPFVGGIADIADGNIQEGAKTLVIDVGSFFVTGGASALRNAYKGMKIIKPFSTKAFVASGATLLRSVFNPMDGIVDIKEGPRKGYNLYKKSPVVSPHAKLATVSIFRGLHLNGDGFYWGFPIRRVRTPPALQRHFFRAAFRAPIADQTGMRFLQVITGMASIQTPESPRELRWKTSSRKQTNYSHRRLG